MSSTKRIFLGVAMALLTVASGFSQYEPSSRSDSYARSDVGRNGYSYVRETVGGVTVQSSLNGRVTARRNMPISAGDEILVSDAGRAEIGLADGNLLFVGGGTRARFSSLYAQQGEDDDFSAIDLRDGSVVLASMGADDESIPRVDTEDATVYLSAGSRVRVNADPRRGTVVVVRAGSAEVRTRSDSFTVEAGQYLMVEGDEEPEISRGVFSRDRFDLWASDRLESLYADTGRSTSVQYVDDDYASDVVALDDYGDWEYSDTYSTQVWVPRVNINWTPYSSGSWYYTPIGLTWWSYDPWGWYPHHYGNWYFDARSRWCWAPSYAYSPAWVYWGYTSNYVGWCPVGYYSFYSPWYDNYYRRWGWSGGYSRRNNLMFALSGSFKTSRVDFGGWNFVANKSFGSTYDRLPVVSGSRLVSAIGDQLAISPKPIVVSGRGGGITQALQDYVRQAPGVIERTRNKDSARLAPVLARDKSLPPSTLDALQERAVVSGRGRLGGPGAEELSARGTVVERGRTVSELLGSRGFEKGSGNKASVFERGRKPPVSIMPRETTSSEAPMARVPRNDPETREIWRGRGREVGRVEAPDVSAMEKERGGGRPEAQDSPRAKNPDRVAPAPASGVEEWRQRGRGREVGRVEAPESPRPGKNPERVAPAPASGVEGWRQRGGVGRQAPPPQAPVIEAPRQKPGKSVAREEDWRGRSQTRAIAPRREARSPEPAWRSRDDSPAKRVIDGAVPGRRWQDEAPRARESAPADWRQRSERPAPAPREYRGPQERAPRYSTPQREYRPEAREYKAPPQREYRPEYRPEPREYRAPPQREYRPEYRPEPREYRAPPQREYRPENRAPQREYRPAPAPRIERAAPAPPPAAAPPPSSYKGRGNGRGNKG